MKIHFSWTISANKTMEIQSKIMIFSTKGMKCHNTIWVQKKEYAQISSSLKKIADIQIYELNNDLLVPWSTTPKWSVEPQGDVIVGIDSDVMIWNQKLVIDAAKKCFENAKILGTIAYSAPFQKEEWEIIFKRYGMKDGFQYEYTNTKEKSPCYINMGVVMISKNLLFKFRESYNKWLLEMNKHYYENYYLCQIAAAMTIKELGEPFLAMPKTFNYLETANLDVPDLSNVTFLHYNISRQKIKSGGIDAIKNLQIRNRFKELLEIKMI